MYAKGNFMLAGDASLKKWYLFSPVCIQYISDPEHNSRSAQMHDVVKWNVCTAESRALLNSTSNLTDANKNTWLKYLRMRTVISMQIVEMMITHQHFDGAQYVSNRKPGRITQFLVGAVHPGIPQNAATYVGSLGVSSARSGKEVSPWKVGLCGLCFDGLAGPSRCRCGFCGIVVGTRTIISLKKSIVQTLTTLALF